MTKIVKFTLIIIGVILVAFGVYDFVNSKIFSNDVVLTMVLGLVAVVLGVVGGKTYK